VTSEVRRGESEEARRVGGGEGAKEPLEAWLGKRRPEAEG